MEHTFKLSQKHDDESYGNILRELELKRGASAANAAEMRRRRTVIGTQPSAER